MTDIARLADALIDNFRIYFDDSKRDKAIVGVSGGVDSAVVAAIAAQAIGPDKLFALRLPHQEFSSEENLKDARAVCEQLRLPAEEIEISKLCERFFALPFAAGRMTRGNIMARVRMILLYAAANEQNGLVLGTGNKTELLTGFFTKYGDGGVDVEVIGEIWKMEVFALAEYFGLPKNLLSKPPSAELFRGHTDEKELGVDYPTLDHILQQMEGNAYFHVNNPSEKIVQKLVDNARHKRGEVPVIARVS